MNTNIQTKPSSTDQPQLVRTCKRVRLEFYERIASLVKTPTKFTATGGIAWPTFKTPWEFNSLIVLPYVGSFDQPGQRYPNGTLRGVPIPRIHLNQYCYEPSKVQLRRWFGTNIHSRPAVMSQHSLELTVGLEELVDFAPWVLDWLKAVEQDEARLVSTPPHPLHPTRMDCDLLKSRYEWSAKAHQEYRRRRCG